MADDAFDGLGDVVSALEEFSGRLGLPPAETDVLLGHLRAVKAGLLGGSPADAGAEHLERVRAILRTVRDNPIAAAALKEIAAVLG